MLSEMRYDLSIIKKIIHTCFWIDDIDVLKENIKSSKRRKMIDIFDLSLCRCGLFDRRYTILSQRTVVYQATTTEKQVYMFWTTLGFSFAAH